MLVLPNLEFSRNVYDILYIEYNTLYILHDVCIYIYVYIHIYIYNFIYMYIIYMHIYIYTYTHIISFLQDVIWLI